MTCEEILRLPAAVVFRVGPPIISNIETRAIERREISLARN